jgi:hypothetical protein
MLAQRGRQDEVLQINGISLHLEDQGNGSPVLLLDGWPDSASCCSAAWVLQIQRIRSGSVRDVC